MTSCVSQRCHNYMTEQLGLPVWGSYIIFGLATLFSGLALGLVSGNSSVLEYKWHLLYLLSSPFFRNVSE